MLGKDTGELALGSKEIALEIMDKLIDEHYVVMLSREENLYIVNYEYSHNSDRNEVVFMGIDEHYGMLKGDM